MNARRALHVVGFFAIAVFLLTVGAPKGGGEQNQKLVYRPYDVGEVDFGTLVPAMPETVKAGKTLYMANCARCHGLTGKGDGPLAYLMSPKPRDFTQKLYKVRTTPSSQLPTDQDLYRAITLGMPGAGMPPWKGKLSQKERWQLVHYIKTLYPQWEATVRDFPLTPISISKRIAASKDSIARGKELYRLLECWKCHGDRGKGDGPSSDELEDDWGSKILPGDLTKPWFFRVASSPEDIYRLTLTGVQGTPMPSYDEEILNESDRWHLVNFVLSLTEGRPPEPVLIEALKSPTFGIKAFEEATKIGSAAGTPDVVFDVVASGWEMWVMKDGKYLPRVNGLAQAGQVIRVKKGQVVQINFWPTDDGLGVPHGHGFSIEGYDDRLYGLYSAAGPVEGSGAAYVEHPLAYRFVADRTGEFPYYCSIQCDPGQVDQVKKMTGIWGHSYMGGSFIVEE